ncbi:MAG TPA: hypothetical protein VIP11_26855 [Gemmatimonadaceae bacterium]
MLKLPLDYPEIVSAGVGALRGIGARLRADADRRAGDANLWLSVRDIEGLADRLDGMGDWEWQNGFADLLVTSQDVGMLDDLVTGGVATNQPAVLAPLRDLLRRYCDGEFEFDEPAA